jgi:hypothetical protein
VSSRAVTREPGPPLAPDGGGPATHHENPDKPDWCICGLAGMYEVGKWVCPRSYKREPVAPVSLTRGGFMLRR